MTTIGETCRLEGYLESTGPVRVEGRVEGELVCRGQITIAPGGQVWGVVRSPRLLVEGGLFGEAEVTDTLEVTAQGKMWGELLRPPTELILDPGATLGSVDGLA